MFVSGAAARRFLLCCFFLFIFGTIFHCPFSLAAVPPELSWVQLQEADLAAFEGLSDKERDRRRKEAEELVSRMGETSAAPVRLTLLQGAIGANPAEPLHWLKVAELCREMGEKEAARAALASARSLFNGTRGQHRKDCVREYSLTLAWLEYELGNWNEGAAWGAKAREAGAGLQGVLVETLNLANRPLTQQEFNGHLYEFLPWSEAGSNRGADAMWCMFIWFHLHNVFWEEEPVTNWAYKDPKLDQNHLVRWRDLGMICETNHKGNVARVFYEKSFQAIPGREGGWLTRIDRTLPGFPSNLGPMPVWVNTNEAFVTGSLYGYADYCCHKLEINTDPGRRAIWAERLLTTAAACRHRYHDLPWLLYWRGVAFMAVGENNEAEGEFLNARDEFERLGSFEPRLNPAHAHLLMRKKKYTRAAPMLEQGVRDFPTDAVCWGDLGVVRVYQGRQEEARDAFDRSLELNPGNAAVWRNRSLLSLQQARWQAALEDMRQASLLEPEDVQIQAELAQITAKVQASSK